MDCAQALWPSHHAVAHLPGSLPMGCVVSSAVSKYVARINVIHTD